MSFAQGRKIGSEFIDDVLRVYHEKVPLLPFHYHVTRYEGTVYGSCPVTAFGLFFEVFTRTDVNREKIDYVSFRLTGQPALDYIYG